MAVWRLLSRSDKVCHGPLLLMGLLPQSHTMDDKTAHSWSVAVHAKSASVPNMLSPVKFHSLCWSFWHWWYGYSSSSEVSSKAHAYAIGMKCHQQLGYRTQWAGAWAGLVPTAVVATCCWKLPLLLKCAPFPRALVSGFAGIICDRLFFDLGLFFCFVFGWCFFFFVSLFSISFWWKLFLLCCYLMKKPLCFWKICRFELNGLEE